MENEAKLRMMRFWLAGTVIIVIGMVSIASYFLTNTVGSMTAEALGDAADSANEGMAVFSTPQYWLTVAIAVVLSVVWYYIYKAILNRQS
jgi:uncharacterized membrane protein YjgN (DUF898 family)